MVIDQQHILINAKLPVPCFAFQAVGQEKEVLINDYVSIYYNNKCALRPSCYECPYATTERKVDLTIGDFWGIA